MTGYVLDCCTLLNLHCAWGGIWNLKSFPSQFHLGSIVAREVFYVREFDATGRVFDKTLTASDLSSQCALPILFPTEAELDETARLSRWLDDGEAEGLAIAASRGMAFCTDDGAVNRLVLGQDLQVLLVSTPELLQTWARGNANRIASLPAAVKRIAGLGRFTPSRSSPHLDWWIKNLA